MTPRSRKAPGRSLFRLLGSVFACLIVLVAWSTLRKAGPPVPEGAIPPTHPSEFAPEHDYDTLARGASGTRLPPDVRIWALQRLAAHPDPRSTGVLLDALGDALPRVVNAAVEALRQKDDPRVAVALASLRDHPDPSVQAAVRRQLESRSGS